MTRLARFLAAAKPARLFWRRPAFACLATVSLGAAALLADFSLALILSHSADLFSYMALVLCVVLGILFSSAGSYAVYLALNGLFAPKEDPYM